MRVNKKPGNRVNGHQPPKLGDVEFEPARGRWNVRRAGEMVAEGVTLQQMLGVIRGERTVESLQVRGKSNATDTTV